jgi:hypothetical protein
MTPTIRNIATFWAPGFRVIAGLALLLLSGCGYAWSSNGDSFNPQASSASNGIYRQNVRTVAVPIFTNQTYYRGIEFNLSKAVIAELESRTPYKVVPKDQADTLLQGEIINVMVHNISRSPFNALPQEQLLVIVVDFTWKDMRTGQIFVERRGFEQSAPYYPTLGEDQSAGTQDNIEKLALAIVEELQAPWGKTGKSN